MQYGCMAFKPGYVGPFVAPGWGSAYDTDFHIVQWKSNTPEVCTVDENGILTAVAPGFAQIELTLTDQEGGGYYCITHINVSVSDEVRIPDYTDHAPCSHSYAYSHTVPATCAEAGYEVYTCSGCGASYTVDLPIDPEAHAWDGTVCTLCGDTRLTPFDDVAEGSFYEEAVAWAVAMGVTNGVSATSFDAAAICNRASVVTFLWRAAGSPDPKSMDNPFTDVQKGSFYEKAVLWAVEEGITNGISDTCFDPAGSCNRASVVTFLWRAAGEPAPDAGDLPFADVPANAWFAEPVLWAVQEGVTNGVSATSFDAAAICNRASVVTFLWRSFRE